MSMVALQTQWNEHATGPIVTGMSVTAESKEVERGSLSEIFSTLISNIQEKQFHINYSDLLKELSGRTS
jgi:hypothetical protein